MKAFVRPMALPDAPPPTKPQKRFDPREVEHWRSIAEHQAIAREVMNKGGRPPKWTDGKTQKLKRLYNEGHTIRTISQELAQSQNSVKSRLDYLMKKGEVQRRNARLSDEDRAKAIKMYRHGMRCADIAKHFHCSTSTIQKICRGMK